MKKIAPVIALLALVACQTAEPQSQQPRPSMGGYDPSAGHTEMSTAMPPASDIFVAKQASFLSYSTPYVNFGGIPRNVAPVFVGFGMNNGSNWVVYQRTSDFHCTWYWVNSGAMTGTQISISGSLDGDTLYAAFSGQSQGVWCANYGVNYPLYAPSIAANQANTVSFNGTGGNDYFIVGGATAPGAWTTTLVGGNNNDHMYFNGYNQDVSGNDGNDSLVNYTSSSSTAMRGGAGADCLSSPQSSPFAFYDCGSGSDSSWPFALGSTNCETLMFNDQCP